MTLRGGRRLSGRYGDAVDKQDRQWSRPRFAAAPVARLATLRPDGQPHLVPVVFALDGDTVWMAVDDKPKVTRDLRRLGNIRVNGRVSLLVDHYEADWARLWWVRADGSATVHDDPTPHSVGGVALLVDKYEQYRRRPPSGPVIEVTVDVWRSWSAGPG